MDTDRRCLVGFRGFEKVLRIGGSCFGHLWSFNNLIWLRELIIHDEYRWTLSGGVLRIGGGCSTNFGVLN